MRIVHFCDCFSPLSETFIYDHVSEVERQGATCHVLTLERSNEETRPFDGVYTIPAPPRWNAGRLWRRSLAAFGKGTASGSYWPLLTPSLKEALVALAPDVIHAHFGPMGALIAPLAQILGIPLVVSCYGYDVSVLIRKKAWRSEYRTLFNQATRLIGISNHICNKLIALGAPPEKVHLMHLGIRPATFRFSSPQERFDGKTVRCLHVGRLVEKKDPIRLTQAIYHAQTLLGDTLTLQLQIAGDGPLRRKLEKTILDLGIQDQVTLLGAVEHTEIPALMQSAHLYTQHCVTARDGDQEGQGVSFVEASATGLPIVSTWHNGLPDVILHEETGFLVPEGHVREMGDRIAALASNPSLWTRLGQRGRAHVEANFNLEKQVRRLIQLYEETLETYGKAQPALTVGHQTP